MRAFRDKADKARKVLKVAKAVKVIKRAGGLKSLKSGWRGVSRGAAIGGAVDIVKNAAARNARINQDGRRNKKWRKARDKALRPVARTLLGAHPIGFVLSRLFRI